MTRRRTALAAAAAGGLLVAACGGTAASPSSADQPAAPAHATATATATVTAAAAAATPPTKVLVIVEENHTETSALRGMPYLAQLARTYGHTTAYKAVTHPSLPNYLAIAGGSTFGVKDDASPSAHHVKGASVFDQAVAAGRSAEVYAESMPSACALKPRGRYAVKHNAWAYFSDKTSRADCREHDVPAGTTRAGALHRDLRAGTLPTIGELIPNLCHDAHDCSLATADSWLRTWINAIQTGADWKAGRLAVVITFDEDDRKGTNTVLTTVVAPHTKHVVSRAKYTHYSLTRYLDHLIGAPLLRKAAEARSLRPAFHL